MNKKALVVLCGILMTATTGAFAQKSKIREANKAYETAVGFIALKNASGSKSAEDLSDPSIIAPLEKAIAAANEAVASSETANNADAWFAKGAILIEMSKVAHFSKQKPYLEAVEALSKAYELSPKVVKKDGFEDLLMNAAIFSFNGGIGEINEEKYDDVVKSMRNVKTALIFDDNKLNKSRQGDKDTMIADAEYYIGYGQYLKKDFENAKISLEAALKNPITQKKPDAFRVLAFTYDKIKDFDKQIATIESAKKLFPKNKDLETDELNYYITQNKTAELVSKFEDAVTREPNNALYLNNLGVLYRNMGMEKDGKFPADAESWHKKAEAQMRKAIEIEPNNAIYSYNLSTVQVIKADLLGNQMNNLGSSKADNQKYDQLVILRANIINQALETLVKVEGILEPKLLSKKISGEEKGYYFDALQTMTRLYANINNPTKRTEYKNKLEDYEQKYY